MALNTPIFHVRGDSKDARVSQNGKTCFDWLGVGSTAAAVEADATTGVFGGFLINKTGTLQRALHYIGANNMSQQQAFTILLRIKWTQASGAPTNPCNFWTIGGGQTVDAASGSVGAACELSIATNGNIQLWLTNNLAQQISNAIIGNKVNWVQNQCYDIWLTHSVNAGVANTRLYIDTTLVANLNSGILSSTAPSRRNALSIAIGNGVNQGAGSFGNYSVNEFAIWNTDESANIVARTGWLSTTAFDALSYVVPTDAQIVSGVAVTRAGVSSVGTAVIPDGANVLEGVQTGVALGTYVPPDQGDVLETAAYGPNGSINGTAILPNGTDVRAGFGDFGNPSSPITASLDVPSAEFVLTEAQVDGGPGLYRAPPADKVQKNYSYGVDPEIIPELEVVGTLESTDPGVSNVTAGVSYIIESASKTGTRETVTNATEDAIAVMEDDSGVAVFEEQE